MNYQNSTLSGIDIRACEIGAKLDKMIEQNPKMKKWKLPITMPLLNGPGF